jgi:ribonucleoside-diphosphate reductase alpha chain
VRAAEISTQARRSLGIGYIGLAHFLAKNKVRYEDKEALTLVHELTEQFQYSLLKASNELASERGACEYYDRTKYSKGILPIDTYKKAVDTLGKFTLKCDWDKLRKSIDEHGLRHSTLSSQMPSESSSVVSNATNGVEPPRDYLSVKKSKKGTLKQVVPQYSFLKNFYTLLWDMKDNDGYIKIISVMQKFFDQSISGNWSYNPENYENNEVPISVMAKDLLTTYKYGWKTAYYQNTMDGKTEDVMLEPVTWVKEVNTDDDEDDCEACAI